MKKFAILAGLMSLALVIGVAGTSLHTGTAQARPTDVVAFSTGVCGATVTDILVNDEDVDYSNTDPANLGAVQQAGAICGALYIPANLAELANILDGSVDDPDTYGLLVDRTAGQLGNDDDFGQNLWVLTFVTNDEPLHLDADEGVWASTAYVSSQTDCPFADADCDDNALTDDGVVVDLLSGAADGLEIDTFGLGRIGQADLGDAIVTATQAGIDVEMDYTVVGMPDDLTLTATKDTIQEGAADEDCSLGDFVDVIGLPTIAGLTATIVDEDGTELTGIRVLWESSDSDNATLALWQGDGDSAGTEREITYGISSSGAVIAPNLACGGDTGDVTFTASVQQSNPAADDADDFGYVTTNIDDETDLTVVGAPDSMTLAANPPSIVCNGTNSSEVSATLLDSAGKAVVAGNKVRFEVVALGTADPIIASTDANGVAKSKITPLTGVTAGVTVLVSVVDNTDIEQNILVACQPAVPIVVPTAPPTEIGPPRTGDGGYLP